MASKIPIDHHQLAELCRRRHIRSLSLFGSVLRDDFGPASDIDVLVEFEPDHVPGLDFFLIEEELSRLFGRRGRGIPQRGHLPIEGQDASGNRTLA